ncbi:hypothetical protein NBG77_17965, partial [Proteus terrae]
MRYRDYLLENLYTKDETGKVGGSPSTASSVVHRMRFPSASVEVGRRRLLSLYRPHIQGTRTPALTVAPG